MEQEEAERQALRMLKRAMSENRWYPRRHMQLFFLIGLPLLIILLALISVYGGTRQP